jgi:hypothetical protein
MRTLTISNQPGKVALWASVLVAALAPAAPALAGDIDALSMFRNLTSLQTADGASLTDAGAFLSLSASTAGAVLYSDASVTVPGASSPQTLTVQSATRYDFQTAGLPDKAAMDTAFPAGTYVVNLSDGTSSAQAAFTLGGDVYAQSQPYLAGTSWSALQGMNASAAMTVQLSPFVTNPAAQPSFIFFTLYDYTAAQWVYDAGFLPPGTPAITLQPNLLVAGHSYVYEIDFSSRLLVDSPGANFQAQIGYELRTQGEFTTAVPEPASWLLLAAGIAAIGARRHGAGAGNVLRTA